MLALLCVFFFSLFFWACTLICKHRLFTLENLVKCCVYIFLFVVFVGCAGCIFLGSFFYFVSFRWILSLLSFIAGILLFLLHFFFFFLSTLLLSASNFGQLLMLPLCFSHRLLIFHRISRRIFREKKKRCVYAYRFYANINNI